ncbi:hypothetical protein [Ilumatobacter nonamiensis]|uniref:hypothetical protein n=1 Tax=Ilumatobacter nonamiensis TaxID=467093 RepID=UPI00034C067F|nr:hypothetical protein [Ilumatobacter nonamiensis]
MNDETIPLADQANSDPRVDEIEMTAEEAEELDGTEPVTATPAAFAAGVAAAGAVAGAAAAGAAIGEAVD